MSTNPLRMSWSRMRLHAECHAKGDLIGRGLKPSVTDIRNFFPGTVADRVMRRWLDQDNPLPGQMEAWTEEIFNAEEVSARETGDGIVRWRNPGDRKAALALCLESARRLEPLLQRVCLPYDWQPASRFAVPLLIPAPEGGQAEILLVGEYDLLVEMPAGIVMWDLKLTLDGTYWRKVKAQLVFYCIAMAIACKTEAGLRWPVAAGLLQPMCEQQDPMWAFSAEDYTQMFTRIVTTAHDIWGGRLQPKQDNTGCSRCEVRGLCPKFPHGRGRVGLGVSPA